MSPYLTSERTFYVFGISNCKWCDAAIDLLLSKGEDYTYFAIDEDAETEDDVIITFLYKYTGFKSAPQIWCNSDHIGGYTELKKFFDDEGS